MTNNLTHRLKSLVLLTASLVIFSSGTRIVFAEGAAAPSAAPTSGIVPVGPSDPLNVTVAGEPDLTNTYVVDPDGNIELPYIGKVHVGGLSPDQSAALLQQKLSQIYTSPQVTVTRTGLGGISVNVIGSVEHQGTVPLRRDAHLNDAVQLAAPSTDADIKHIKVTQGEPGQQHVTQTYDLDSFLNGGNIDGNPALQDGDTIFIPKLTQAQNSVSITGEVIKPGRYGVAPGATVFDAIAQAGGLSPTADPAGTYIQPFGTTTQIPFNYTSAAENPADPKLNPIVHDGDEIVVPLASTLPTYAITGAVLRGGEFPLKGVVSLLDAIASAGGLEDRADAKKTTVTRATAHGPNVITVNAGDTKTAATFYLQPGDNITVPHGGPAPTPLNPFEVVSGLASIYTLIRL